MCHFFSLELCFLAKRRHSSGDKHTVEEVATAEDCYVEKSMTQIAAVPTSGETQTKRELVFSLIIYNKIDSVNGKPSI